MKQSFRVIKLENQGLDGKTTWYLRLDQEGHEPVNISIGETNYNKLKAMENEKTMGSKSPDEKVDNNSKKR